MKKIHTVLLWLTVTFAYAQTPLYSKIDAFSTQVEPKVIEWRRYFHQNPELSNREFKTAERIASQLRSLGIEVKTGVAHTGVVGILKGSKPGPVVALRADIDALPVTERRPLAFASTVKTMYRGQETGVMHACGHDTHMAILLGVAEVLSKMKDDLKGTVKFIFQPCEEGAPDGEEGGAMLMVKEGVMENPKVDVIFGLHINSELEVGKIGYKPGGFMAAVDEYKLTVTGKQTHGAYPWLGVDPVVTSAQIIMGLQTLVSRNMDITEAPAVFTVGAIHGGIRENIIPEKVEMIGTIRTFDTTMRKKMLTRMVEISTNIAESAGAKVEVKIDTLYPVTYNHLALTEKMLPTLRKAAGADKVVLQKARTGAEDFSFYQQKVPGLFFNLGGRPKDVPEGKSFPHHTPDFFIDESGFGIGVRAFCYLTVDYMNSAK